MSDVNFLENAVDKSSKHNNILWGMNAKIQTNFLNNQKFRRKGEYTTYHRMCKLLTVSLLNE